jgi:N-acetylglucosamine kinase-like BadF-type ATPase
MDGTRSYVIGLDGGGTKTSVQLADSKGQILAESLGGPANLQIIGVEQSAKTIIDLIETCCHTVGCEPTQIGSVVAGLAGAGRQSDQLQLAEAVRGYAQDRGVYLRDLAVASDARIALEGAFLGDPGIIVIAGTGSIVCGKDREGKMHRAGGWGRLIGDQGSGYQIGREGVRAIARMIDGVSGKTAVAALVADEFGLRSQDEIIKAVYRDGFDFSTVAPLVIRAAQDGDRIALNILGTAALELVAMIHAVIGRLKQYTGRTRGKIPLVFVGSLLDPDNVYSAKVRALIRKELKSIIVEKPIASPVRGAVLMALARMKKGTQKTARATVD